LATSTSLTKAGPAPAFVLANVSSADGVRVAAFVPLAAARPPVGAADALVLARPGRV
jgi:hypothetical protein